MQRGERIWETGARIHHSGGTIEQTRQRIVQHPAINNEHMVSRYQYDLHDTLNAQSPATLQHALLMERLSATLSISDELIQTSVSLVATSLDRIQRRALGADGAVTRP